MIRHLVPLIESKIQRLQAPLVSNRRQRRLYDHASFPRSARAGLQALLETVPQQKVPLALSLLAQAATLSIAPQSQMKIPASLPGCPAQP